MLPPALHSDNPSRLGERLAAARHRRFVGRTAERDLFRAALLDRQAACAVLHVHGPGGVGKSALLGEFARIAEELGVTRILLDGRQIEPSPSGFLDPIRLALGLSPEASPFDTLAAQPRAVLLIDTYERLAPLDPWLRETCLPQLPAQTLVVLAGRNSPPPAWSADPGWHDITRALPLRNLRPEESRTYLAMRGIAEARHADVPAFTHGHPLALALVADALARGDDHAARIPEREPDIVRVLLERFIEHVPSPRHRLALEACAHVRVTTEPLLSAALETDDSSALFAWLRGLSFIQEGPQGLYPHDLAREVLDADLRWRNPQRYHELHRRVRDQIVREFQSVRGREQQRAFFDLLYLHRHNPVMKPFVDWSTLGAAYAEPATPQDAPAILDIVRRHEGDQSAAIARHWLQRQPGAFTVFRGGDGLLGFIAGLALHQVIPEDVAVDPAVAAAIDFADRHGPARPGEAMVYHRFHMGRAPDEPAPAVHNMVAMTSTIDWLTTPRLAWSFLAVPDPDQWHATMTYLNLRRAPQAEFEVGGWRYAVYAHDWRAEPPLTWLDVVGERELAANLEVDTIAAAQPPPLIVLSQPDFTAAVHQALRDFHRLPALAANPLLRSRLASEHAGGEPSASTLQALVREAAEILRGNPRDEKRYRAILHTYLKPAATQELAAERLGLPFSTYRYQLGSGIERVTQLLWQRELSGSAS